MKFKIMVLAALIGLSALSIQADELPDGPYIVTSGAASADAASNIATLVAEVDITAKDAASAKKQADEHVVQYLPFLKQNRVAKKDISVANLRIQPDCDHQNGKSVLKGYRAVHTVEVTLHQLDRLNTLFSGASEAGLNEIRSVLFGIAQPGTYKDEARRAATDDAIHQAERLATGFNSRPEPVYSVRYHVPSYQLNLIIRMMKVDVTPATSAQGTYEQPVIQFDDRVDVVFQIELMTGQPTATSAKTQ